MNDSMRWSPITGFLSSAPDRDLTVREVVKWRSGDARLQKAFDACSGESPDQHLARTLSYVVQEYGIAGMIIQLTNGTVLVAEPDQYTQVVRSPIVDFAVERVFDAVAEVAEDEWTAGIREREAEERAYRASLPQFEAVAA